VELASGERVLLDDVLGHGFAVLQLAGTPASQTPGPLPSVRVAVVRRADDFLPELAEAHPGATLVRDIDGTLEALLASAGAQAIVLRPDRYVLAYLREGAHSRWLGQELLDRLAGSPARAEPAFVPSPAFSSSPLSRES
jgi:3-(3-hydroxy-phenyl)propionate hydroxylase